jgi:hypothetical protein
MPYLSEKIPKITIPRVSVVTRNQFAGGLSTVFTGNIRVENGNINLEAGDIKLNTGTITTAKPVISKASQFEMMSTATAPPSGFLKLYSDLNGKLRTINELNVVADVSPISDPSTGVISGGLLSLVSGAQYNISAGKGDLNNLIDNTITNVSWVDKLSITLSTISAGVISHIGINITGNVVEQSSRFTSFQQRSILVLGSLYHYNMSDITFLNQDTYIKYQPVIQTHDLMDVLGMINIVGNKFSSNSSTLNIQKSKGSIFKTGSNYANMSDSILQQTGNHVVTCDYQLNAQFIYVFQNGSISPVNSVPIIDINPNIMDNGAAPGVSVKSNYFTIQRIYLSTSSNIYIQPGQVEYVSQLDAVNAISTELYNVDINLQDNGLLRAYMIVQQGTTDLDLAVFIPASKFGSNVFGGGGGGTGDVIGPLTSTDNSIVLWNGTGGDAIQNSGVSIDSSQNITGVTNLTSDSVKTDIMSDKTLSSTVSLNPTDITLAASNSITLNGISVDNSQNITGVSNLTSDSLSVKLLSTENEVQMVRNYTGGGTHSIFTNGLRVNTVIHTSNANIDLPLTPLDGITYTIINLGNSTVTILGSDISGGTSLVLDTQHQRVTLQYVASRWYIV